MAYTVQRNSTITVHLQRAGILPATKIEFFVGDGPEGSPLSFYTAWYTRLGHVSFSDNEKTGYKVGELKSVHVDAMGVYLKLNIHKNHVNKLNPRNQVGIIAINVIGDKLRKYYYADQNYTDVSDKDPALEGFLYSTDYISPLDDLAFDMSQDPEIAQIIHRLDLIKQEAVLQERYGDARRLKHAISELMKVGERLGKLEVEKQQAVENEDYGKAKEKKLQVDGYRLQIYKDLNLSDWMEIHGVINTRYNINGHPIPVQSRREISIQPDYFADIIAEASTTC